MKKALFQLSHRGHTGNEQNDKRLAGKINSGKNHLCGLLFINIAAAQAMTININVEPKSVKAGEPVQFIDLVTTSGLPDLFVAEVVTKN